MNETVLLAGPLRHLDWGRDVERWLEEKEGKRVVGSPPASTAVAVLREGEWVDLQVVDRLRQMGHREVLCVLDGKVRLPDLPAGWKWKDSSRSTGRPLVNPVGLEEARWTSGCDREHPLWRAASVVKDDRRPEGAAGWTMPRPSWKNGQRVGWDPKTWVKVETLARLPQALLGQVRVYGEKDKNSHEWKIAPYLRWVRAGDRPYFDIVTIEETGEQFVRSVRWGKLAPVNENESKSLPYLTGQQVLNRAPGWESFMMSVAGWPLEYVPRKYLRWLVTERARVRLVRGTEGDVVRAYHAYENTYSLNPDKDFLPGEYLVTGGWFLKTEKVPGRRCEIPVQHWEFQPCEGVLREKIMEFLSLPEFLQEEEEMFDYGREEYETRAFYPTGYWAPGQTRTVLGAEDRELEVLRGKEWKKVKVPAESHIQKFVNAGVSKPLGKWGASGNRPWQRSQDPDPTPEGWVLGLNGRMYMPEPDRYRRNENLVKQDWRPAPGSPDGPEIRSPEQAWKVALDRVSWMKQLAQSLERRNAVSGWMTLLNREEQEQEEKEREEAWDLLRVRRGEALRPLLQDVPHPGLRDWVNAEAEMARAGLFPPKPAPAPEEDDKPSESEIEALLATPSHLTWLALAHCGIQMVRGRQWESRRKVRGKGLAVLEGYLDGSWEENQLTEEVHRDRERLERIKRWMEEACETESCEVTVS